MLSCVLSKKFLSWWSTSTFGRDNFTDKERKNIHFHSPSLLVTSSNGRPASIFFSSRSFVLII